MKTTRELAADLRARLKAAGYSSRKVSVRAEDLSTDSAIRVVLKDLGVRIDAVRALAAGIESIHRDSATGEILSGGNLYLSISYDPVAIEPARALSERRISALEPGESVVVAGICVLRETADPSYYRVVTDREIRCWGAGFAAKHVVYFALGGEPVR